MEIIWDLEAQRRSHPQVDRTVRNLWQLNFELVIACRKLVFETVAILRRCPNSAALGQDLSVKFERLCLFSPDWQMPSRICRNRQLPGCLVPRDRPRRVDRSIRRLIRKIEIPHPTVKVRMKQNSVKSGIC